MVSGAKQLMGGLVAAALVTLMALASTAGAASLRAHGSVQQVYVIGAHADERLTLFDGHGARGGWRSAPGRSVALCSAALRPEGVIGSQQVQPRHGHPR